MYRCLWIENVEEQHHQLASKIHEKKLDNLIGKLLCLCCVKKTLQVTIACFFYIEAVIFLLFPWWTGMLRFCRIQRFQFWKSSNVKRSGTDCFLNLLFFYLFVACAQLHLMSYWKKIILLVSTSISTCLLTA